MKQNNMKNQVNSDIIERYCPKLKENVVMKRTFGLKTRLTCMNYSSCDRQKDEHCTGGAEM